MCFIWWINYKSFQNFYAPNFQSSHLDALQVAAIFHSTVSDVLILPGILI